MFTRINQAIDASRLRRIDNEKGFTLIELLVVVLIIGILSAVAIPIFLGQQDQAKNAGAKSDLTNAKVALISYATANSGTYTTDTSLLADFGYVASDTTSALTVVNPTSAGFCIEATSTAAGSPEFHITHDAGVADGGC